MWVFRHTILDRDGNPTRKSLYGATKADVMAKLATQRLLSVPAKPPSSLTMAEFLGSWLERIQRDVKPTTHEHYATIVRLYVNPFLGDARLTSFRRLQMDSLLLKLQKTDWSTLPLYRKGATQAKLRRVFSCISSALTKAAEWELIEANPLAGVSAPRVTRPVMKTWDEHQAKRFVAGAAKHDLGALFILALATGMREGELLAMRWSDILFENGMISVQHTLTEVRGKVLGLFPVKTDASVRSVHVSEAVLDLLKQHREQIKLIVPSDCPWVFPSRAGTNLTKSNLLKSFHRLCDSLDVPRIRFHDLRHTHATLLLLSGINVKVVSERLGHGQTGITQNTYQHVLPTMQAQAVLHVDALMGLTTNPS